MDTVGNRNRLLVVVAHPDDETFGCRSLLRYAADAGYVTTVLCATRGEAGEAVGTVAIDDLGAVRVAETRAAADILGVLRVDFLDYVDSGFSGDAAPDTLVGATFEDVRSRVGEHIAAFAPGVVVTLDASDGHCDHERIRDATLAAAEAAHVERVYLHCLPQSLMARWLEHLATIDPDSAYRTAAPRPAVLRR